MSFSYDLKTELCDIKSAACCKAAECYGMMLFGHFFNTDKISVLSDNPSVQKNFAYLCKKCFSTECALSSSSGKKPMYKAEITEKNTISQILKNSDNAVLSRLLQNDCCRDAFIRGAFLSCGHIMNPEKEYRAEFRIKNTKFSELLFELLDFRDITPSKTVRGGSQILYFKKSDRIEDLITVMGAGNITLHLMDIKIIKGVRGNINRKNNIDEANTSKMIEASINQRATIKHLIDNDKFDILGDELKEIALLRMANPDASLNELSRLCSVSISKSGINHRLKKITDIAESFKNRK